MLRNSVFVHDKHKHNTVFCSAPPKSFIMTVQWAVRHTCGGIMISFGRYFYRNGNAVSQLHCSLCDYGVAPPWIHTVY